MGSAGVAMRVLTGMSVLWLGAVQAVLAAPLEVTISAQLPAGLTAEPPAISWSATPLDLPEDADILAAMVFTPEPVQGPWLASLEPGHYQISGFSEIGVFETEFQLNAVGPISLSVPEVVAQDRVVFHCAEGVSCAYNDPATGLELHLPKGWALEQPEHLPGMGQKISSVFFEESEAEGAGVWFLNPDEWFEEDNGPCWEVSLGEMCTFEETESAKFAFEIIAPSLRLATTAP